jgi:hypothetical protein
MIWHPLLLTTLVVQASGLLLLAAAALTAFRVVVDWKPASAGREQLILEVKNETAALQTHWALGLYIFSNFLLVVGITNVYPDLIPGAMCGTGVMQAMNKAGSGFLFLNGILLAVLLYWNGIETLNRKQTDVPLTLLSARLILLALPAAVVAFGQTFLAAFGVDVHQPVDCCAVVYNQFRSIDEAHRISGLPDRFWIASWAILSLLMFWAAVQLRRNRRAPSLKWNGFLAIVSALWVPASAVTLVNILSAYHYGVLQHQCPWCLFLLQHKAVGFLLFGALAVIVFEGLAAFLLPAAAQKTPAALPAALDRGRAAAGRVLLALVVFVMLAALPPVVWRIRFGVWIGS